ncbi:hypothetical protein GO003_007390 [Methylicorpusculum oleiharenae]|uniref:hypothetical protein n=1 Tax=Methylicorpusculum oleiharenae TaxID=1338687 RepID=UPI00135CC6A2|nr:hypothetical protein [Methylicorpusculum oleiharenae]MCD2450207.1 hypothetical protein [Methylicorpusculum oleiharenae]
MNTNKTYVVKMIRIDHHAGPNATLSIQVSAPNDRTAKLIAESQCHGYRATSAGRAL